MRQVSSKVEKGCLSLCFVGRFIFFFLDKNSFLKENDKNFNLLCTFGNVGYDILNKENIKN